MKPSALFLSPHLDDVAFSCGGTLLRLVQDAWLVSLCTVFTESVLKPKGFALACQLDKGLSADADYMAIRREEDLRFARSAEVNQCRHLSFREAPHRGYKSAPDLFAGIHAEDRIWCDLANQISEIAQPFRWIFAPQGLGNHVDHLQLILAVQAAELCGRTIWYTDTPYAIRNPHARPSPHLPQMLASHHVEIDLRGKVDSCALYTTQIAFQFGSRVGLEQKLESFHRTLSGYKENLLCSTEANASPFQSRTMIRGI